MTALLSGVAWGLGLLAAADAARAIAHGGSLVKVERLLAPLRRTVGDGRSDRQGLMVAAAIGAAAGWLAGGSAGAALLGLLAPPGALALGGWRRRRWRRLAAAQAPAAARALAAALRGGHALPAALELAAGDGALSAAGRALLVQPVALLRLGASTEDALGAIARRAGPGPWPALVAGILTQREAGGDLASLLTELADDLDLSARAAAEARGASAQARLTARIVVALPVAGAVLVELAAPGSVRAVAGDPLALALTALALALECVALLIVSRIAWVRDRG